MAGWVRGAFLETKAFSCDVGGNHNSPRQNYLYLSAELTRPCLFKASFTSNHAPQRQDEASTREKPTYANLRGYDDSIRSAYVRTEVNKIMTRFDHNPSRAMAEEHGPSPSSGIQGSIPSPVDTTQKR